MAAVEAAAAAGGSAAPGTGVNVIVLGGTGFIGRNLVRYLVENNLCAKIRVADKKPPATQFFSPEYAAIFANPIVEFKQANLSSDASVSKIFVSEEGSKWNYVFNCAGETNYGQNDSVYETHIRDITQKCAAEAARAGVDRFVEVSTAQVYESNSKPTKEDGKLKPWTSIARFKLEAEKSLAAIPGLNYNIVRPAVVYGPGDMTGITPRLICAAVYKHLSDKYKVLWSADLKVNTVHVNDVCRALFHIATHAPPAAIFNLADKGSTDQGKINSILEEIFGIKTGFVGTMMSNLAKLDMSSAKSYANDKHMEPWGELCKSAGISTPLTPHISEELLSDDHLSVDGSKVESIGFSYSVPELNAGAVREVIDIFVRQGLFPAVVL